MTLQRKDCQKKRLQTKDCQKMRLQTKDCQKILLTGENTMQIPYNTGTAVSQKRKRERRT